MTTTSLRLYLDATCLAHEVPVGFPERPQRVRSILDRFVGSRTGPAPDGSPDDLDEPIPDPLEDRLEVLESASAAFEGDLDAAIEAVHPATYLARFRAAVERGDGLFESADNPLSPGTRAAVEEATAMALAAVEWVRGAAGRKAFVAGRPPGHHASSERAMGFCYLNPVAIAARAAQRAGAQRVAIVDFDVHHGNGTQDIFERDGEVFFASLHQAPFYPGTGAASERGIGDGLGATLNVPMAAGTGDQVWLEAFDREVGPALDDFAPQALLVSAGFDAWRGDPLGGVLLEDDAFRGFGERLAAVAERHCEGQLVSLLEGGYDVVALPRLVASYLEGLAGSS
ncbi:MAG: histone deacetylase [Acidobacteriota bacterium]